jgi:hypothetical protein
MTGYLGFKNSINRFLPRMMAGHERDIDEGVAPLYLMRQKPADPPQQQHRHTNVLDDFQLELERAADNKPP